MADVKIMAFKSSTQLILFLINTSATTNYTGIPITLSGKTISSTTLDRISWYPGSNIAGYTGTVAKNSSTTFTGTISANAMAIYTFNIQ